MNKLIIITLLSILSSISALSSINRDFYSKSKQKINGSVVKYFDNGDVLLKRSTDMQLFRIKLDIFTEDDQAFVKNNFPPNHESLPKFKKPLSDKDLKINSEFIDKIIESKLRSYGERPNKEISNEAFLRRAYLKIIGRIPTLKEAQDFLGNRDKKSRSKLIDKLLASEGYNKNWYIYWADILRAKTRVGNQGSDGYPFIKYIKDSISSNKPYDTWVKEMLSSTGPMWEMNNGAVGYFYRDQGMGLDNMSNTVRVFLGTSLECAQCHDHPFDRWTQKQFYEMAAFTNGAERMKRKDEELNKLSKLVRALQKENPEDRNKIRRAFLPVQNLLSPGLDDLGRGSISLPKDYQYDNAKPGQKLKAKTIFGLAVELDENLEEKGSRSSYASWLASATNPRFSTVIANRLWKSAFGYGLIEPVDNIYDDTLPVHPEMMLHLEKLMVALDFDAKEFLRIVYNTKAFQREAPIGDVIPRDSKDDSLSAEVKWVISKTQGNKPYFYQGPVMQRMSAEQIWDSLVALNFYDLDDRINSRAPEEGFDEYLRYKEMTAEEIFEEIAPKLKQQGATSMTPMKKQESNKKTSPKRKGFLTRDTNSLRASEVGDPAPRGHMILQFGGSPRDQIQVSHKEAAVNQVLALINGYVEKSIINNKKSTTLSRIFKASSMEERINLSFLAILQRKPNSKELKDFKETIKKLNAKDYHKDIVWALINSHEFMFVK